MVDKVLIVGATGMVGQTMLAEARRRGVAAVGAARAGADVAIDLTDAETIERAVDEAAPDFIVNAAAMVAHDLCEREPGLAYLCNARAVALLAGAARVRGARFVQISTDQFFTGDGDRAHTEDDPVTCLPSEYARTKRAGEVFALAHADALVVRTNVTGLRGGGAPSFIEWVFQTAESGGRFTLFDDYFSSTIDTASLAGAVFDLVERGATGLLHVASRDISSKRDFICAAVEALTGAPPAYDVASVATLQTPRAESAGLAVERAEAALGYRLPERREVIEALVTAWRARQ